MNEDELKGLLKAQPLRKLPENWRAEILAASRQAQRSHGPLPSHRSGDLRTRIRQWLWPHPAAWGTLGAACLIALLLNPTPQPASGETLWSSRGLKQTDAPFVQQRQALGDLLASLAPETRTTGGSR